MKIICYFCSEMFQHKYIFIFILLGFLLMPKQIYACDLKFSPAKSSSCETKTVKAGKKHHCEFCGSKTCNGKYNSPLCKCPVSNLNPTIFNKHDFNFLKLKNFNFISFSPYETAISKGFLSIWLIPKIG